jgi:probable rRNA maturation factor
MMRAGAEPPAVDVIVDSPLWSSEAEAVVRRAIAASAEAGSSRNGELAIVLTDNSAIRQLNRQWRGLDEPTNVLSFPAADEGQTEGERQLGDIVIAYEIAAREAETEKKPLTDHLAHLTVHGFLHLLGYDHETDSEADKMEQLEATILARLGVPDPYAARDAGT